VHSLMRAYDYLNEVSDWAGRHQRYPIKFLANLYLAFYEMQQHRLEKSRQLLKEAKYILNLSMNPIDYFNYLFYLGFWLINSRRFDHAEVVIKQLQNKSKEYARYQAVSFYLSGKLYFSRAEFSLAKTAFEKSVKISKKWNYPHLLYLSLSELARKSLVEKDEKARLIAVKKACQQIEKMTREMGDEILGHQFLESKFHEDLISFCKQHNLLEFNRRKDE
jgi:hypothetical protein